MPTINGKSVLDAEISMPFVGAWHASLTVDATALSGKVTFKFDGIDFVGTVLRAGLNGGRLGARLVGGNGGLSKELSAKNYASSAGSKVSAIVGDILREVGEVLSATSEPAILGITLPKWHRVAGPASHALTNLLAKVGAQWRVLRSGEVWVGVTQWTATSPKHILIDDDGIAGILTIAPDAPDLEPGTTFRGQKIDTVIHRLAPSSLRTEAHVDSPGSAVNRFLAGIRREIDYSRTYPGRVSTQNADGTLQIVPDDEKVKGTGLDRVPIRAGIPGLAKIEAPAGVRCVFEFTAGDPSRPQVVAFEPGGVELFVDLGTLSLNTPQGITGTYLPPGGTPVAVTPSTPFELKGKLSWKA